MREVVTFIFNRKVLKFLITGFVLLIIWVIITSIFPEFVYNLHFWIIKPQAYISADIINIMGYDARVEHLIGNCHSLLIINNTSRICIGTGCSGLDIFLIFALFILLLKGKSNDFFWYIPGGIVLIGILNILRIIVLALIVVHAPQYLDFNHKYTFVIIIYGVIFWLWIVWMNRFYKSKNN